MKTFLLNVLSACCFVRAVTACVCNGVNCGDDNMCRTTSCDSLGRCKFTPVPKNLGRTCQVQRSDGRLVMGVCGLTATGPFPNTVQCADVCAGVQCERSTACQVSYCDPVTPAGICVSLPIRSRINTSCITDQGTTGICLLEDSFTARCSATCTSATQPATGQSCPQQQPADFCTRTSLCNPADGQCRRQAQNQGQPCQTLNNLAQQCTVLNTACLDAGGACGSSGTCVLATGACIGRRCFVDACSSSAVCNPVSGECTRTLRTAGTPCQEVNGIALSCTTDDCLASGFTCKGAPPARGRCTAPTARCVNRPCWADFCTGTATCLEATGVCVRTAQNAGRRCRNRPVSVNGAFVNFAEVDPTGTSPLSCRDTAPNVGLCR